MFTGIIEQTGTVKAVSDTANGRRLTIEVKRNLDGLDAGASISVDGCCTTVIEYSANEFTVDLMKITSEKTTLGKLKRRSKVNIERPLKLGGELGGHLVQGHVDGVAKVKSVKNKVDSTLLNIELPSGLVRYVVETGSITLNGVSLTVAEVKGGVVMVGLIPHTMKLTNLSELGTGDEVNVEVDIIAKYIEKQAASPRKN